MEGREAFMRTKPRAQSSVEYIVLVAVVLAALIIFLKPSGFFHRSVEKAINQSLNRVSNLADE